MCVGVEVTDSGMTKKLKEQYEKVLRSKHIILHVVTGSEVLGLSSGDGDRDELAIYIESPEELIGFSTTDKVIWRSAELRTGRTGAKSEKGDVDLTMFGLRKFLMLALGGNPNIVNVLFTPDNFILKKTHEGKELQGLTSAIVSKQASKAFLGYLNSQRLRLMGSKGSKDVNRSDLVSKFGFDTKYAMHMLRLGVQGCELMREGKLTVPMSELYKNFLLKVRNGHRAYSEIISDGARYENEIKDNTPLSPLQEKPDFATVEKWMLATYLEAWGKELDHV